MSENLEKKLPGENSPSENINVSDGAKRASWPQFFPRLLGEKVMVRLMDGRPINGVLRGFNAYEIVMETNGKTMMIFKHAISIIEPNNTKKLALWRGEDR